MELDFLTLFVLIVLNTLSLALVWAAIAVVYRNFIAARYWLASLLASLLGGILLTVDGAGPAAGPTYVGMWLIAAGFCVKWQGVRVFYGRSPLWGIVALIVTLNAIAITLIQDDRAQQNIVYATTQIVPLTLSVLTLLSVRPLRLGAFVAASAAMVALLGDIGEALANIGRVVGVLSTEQYYGVAAWFLVATIVGGGICYLGYLLMAIDRLRSEMAMLATKDDLTGLPNRRGFFERVRRLSGRQRRTNAAIMMIDLDNLKVINDTHGHAAGDASLAHAASVARGIKRQSDILARLSGDEFCLLLPATKIEEAAAIANRLAKAMSAAPLQWRDYLIELSVSVGLAEWHPGSKKPSIDDALENADSALYRTKRAGRDGYTIYADSNAIAASPSDL